MATPKELARIQAWRKAHPDSVAAAQKRYYERNKNKLKVFRDARKAAKAEYDRLYRKKNSEPRAAQKRAYYVKNKHREDARVQAWVETNRKRSHQIKIAWKDRNPDAQHEYYEANRAKFVAHVLARRLNTKRATPAWADMDAIQRKYDAARQCGMSVDHTVPLKGKNVCGLHVDYNMQVMPLADNIRKGNRHGGI